MPQYIVKALDANDEGAIARRKAARPAHLERIKPYVDNKELVFAGAYVNREGNPIGSVFAVEMQDRATLDQWIQADPYIAGGVWRSIEIEEIRIAVRDGELQA